MTQQFTARYIRGELSKQWRARNWHGIWFYGTWLFHRCYGLVFISVPVTAIASILITQQIVHLIHP